MFGELPNNYIERKEAIFNYSNTSILIVYYIGEDYEYSHFSSGVGWRTLTTKQNQYALIVRDNHSNKNVILKRGKSYKTISNQYDLIVPNILNGNLKIQYDP